MHKAILIILLISIGAIVFVIYRDRIILAPGKISTPSTTGSILDPARITKKPFGIYITPSNSSVSPERFKGYHTGVDFETMPAEQSENISVPALCDGKILLKKYATGYGGVVVQSCNLDGQSVTVVYGHLKVTSMVQVVGQDVKKAEILGILGKAYSSETDGERKHLHLGIHRGTVVNLLGYVPKQSELSLWLDPKEFLR